MNKWINKNQTNGMNNDRVHKFPKKTQIKKETKFASFYFIFELD